MAEGGGSKQDPTRSNWFQKLFRRTPTGHNQRQDVKQDHRPHQATACVPNWTNRCDSRSQRKRSEIFHAIVHDQNVQQLRTILDTGWDVNEILEKSDSLYVTTTLHEVARQGWTEGMRMLIDAGARYMTPGTSGTPLELALQNHDCSADMVKYLLKAGAGPKLTKKDSLCLSRVILGMSQNDNFSKIVQLLLENGADPNVAIKIESDWIVHIQSSIHLKYQISYKLGTLSVVLALLANPISNVLSEEAHDSTFNMNKVKQLTTSNAEIFKTLVEFGATVNNPDKPGSSSLLNTLAVFSVKNHRCHCFTNIYLQEHLDVLYQNGHDINMVHHRRGTALEYTVRNFGHSNNVRWLIRHGALIPATIMTMLEGHLTLNLHGHSVLYQQVEDTPLILLQAGMRLSHRVRVLLMEIEKEMSPFEEQSPAHGETYDNTTSEERVHTIWAKLKAISGSVKSMQHNTTLQYFSAQMSDLEKFSNDSLQLYPERDTEMYQTKDKMAFVLGQIRTVLEFLSQPQSLQWCCRRCVRENLISLQPSVVKCLPIPSKLKCFILCHEL